MNYIRHLSTFFVKVASDNRLNSHHVSLYIALFQFWNLNRFENPFQINRNEILQICKIGSLNTYHKCLHELNTFGYIQYIPSHNPMKGSLVNLYNFDTTDNTTLGANSIQPQYNPRRKNDTTDDTTLAPLYKHNKHINNKTICMVQTQNENQILNLENMKTVKSISQNAKRKKVAPKKEKIFFRPSLDEVTIFFKSENYPEVEAQKFFNHFESNGWRVGGKSPMRNWQAASRNWMLNSQKFITPQNFPKPQQKPEPNNKNYAEPL
jgi:hypothetical protein